jgi:hypothetical protein
MFGLPNPSIRQHGRRVIGLYLVFGLLIFWPQIRAFAMNDWQNTPVNPASVLDQAVSSAAVTPSDSTNLTGAPTRGLYNGASSSCNIALELNGDSAAVTFLNVPSGAVLPFHVKRVFATNTTCTNIVALF